MPNGIDGYRVTRFGFPRDRILGDSQVRIEYLTSVVETHILAHGYHGLLIAGLAHFVRDWAVDVQSPVPVNSVQRIERNHPGSVHVIFPHIGFGPETSALEPYLSVSVDPNFTVLGRLGR